MIGYLPGTEGAIHDGSHDGTGAVRVHTGHNRDARSEGEITLPEKKSEKDDGAVKDGTVEMFHPVDEMR